MLRCREDGCALSVSRRAFLRNIALAGGAALLACDSRLFYGDPLGLPPGVQLWTVREEMKTDPDGTLRRLAEIGFREVELFETPKAPREFRKRLEGAGLKCVSGHFELADLKNPAVIAAAEELGLAYMILVFPALRDHPVSLATADFKDLVPLYEKISLADYRFNAAELNQCAEGLKRHGIRTGYHNHAIDFKPLAGGALGFDTLIRDTDPSLVCFEMDCGHVIHTGHDPIAYLNEYPARIELLHVKDLVRGYHISTTLDTEDKDTNAEIGAGCIDWKKLFETAGRYRHLKHYFVEHEGKMAHPPLEALQISYNYLQKLILH